MAWLRALYACANKHVSFCAQDAAFHVMEADVAAAVRELCVA
jgi:hypothetical protein